MGIPYYFYKLSKTYDDILSKNTPDNVNIYCIDFNGIIHPTTSNYIKSLNNKIGPDEDNMIQTLYDKIGYYKNLFNPSKIIVCVDGVAPLSKIVQQRKRRYLSVFRNKIDNTEVVWDTNAITPGTNFMKKLNSFFKKQIRYSTSSTRIIFSGSDEKGEGEHKIFSFLKKEKNGENIIINGLDADLIILSLMSHRQNIYLMRENDTEDTIYININKLRNAIIQEVIIKWDINIDENFTTNTYSNECNDIIESYCVMCSLLGNDFVPHLMTLNLKMNGLERLISAVGTAYKTHGLMVSNSQINYSAFAEVLQIISKNECREIFEITEKYIKNNIHSSAHNNKNKSDFYGIKNKDPVASKIYENISNWKQTYYKHLFYTNISINSTVISNACQAYIYGIYWTYAYYKKQENLDNTWYYPYNYPPSLKDLCNYTIGNTPPIVQSNAIDISPNIQLMIVLPQESHYLIDDKYRKVLENKHSGLYHLHPKEFKIDTYLKTNLWECCPVLPTINIHTILHYIKQ